MLILKLLKKLFFFQTYKSLYQHLKSLRIKDSKKATLREKFILTIFFLIIDIVFEKYINLENLRIVENLINVGLYYFFINFIATFILVLFLSFYRKRLKLIKNYDDNITLGADLLVKLILFVAFFIILFEYGGGITDDLATTLSVLAVGLLWAFSQPLNSLLNGFVISFSKDYNVKDFIQIEDIKGKIIKISFFKTFIQTTYDNVVSIPNTQFLYSKVINFSFEDEKRFVFDFELDINKADKLDKLKKRFDDYFLKHYKDLEILRQKLNVGEVKKDMTYISYNCIFKDFNEELSSIIQQDLLEILSKFLKNKK